MFIFWNVGDRKFIEKTSLSFVLFHSAEEHVDNDSIWRLWKQTQINHGGTYAPQ